MIVAHCDDESIFGGYDLLQNNNWTVIVITNPSVHKKNKYRKNEFINISKKLNFKFEFWNYANNQNSVAKWNIKEIISRINILIKNNNFDMILTHNLMGEYGHLHHKTIHKIIYNNFKNYNLQYFSKDRKVLELQESYEELLNMYESKGGFNGLKHYWDSNKL